MSNATIYTLDGGVLTEGLDSAARSDQAFQVARDFARERGEAVVVEDPEGVEVATYTVSPEGGRGPAPAGWPF